MVQDNVSNNERIVMNTMYMYIRMIITTLISLFTARIVFNSLGIANYGIYNLVGSIIIFFNFINTGLTTATRRYITAEVAKGTLESQQNVFNLSIFAHLLIGLIILILAETIGLFLVNHTLNIPDARIYAANIAYQMSILTALWNVMQAPFSATITAFEKMKIYAYLSIFDVIIKLLIAGIVYYSQCDKLILYSVLTFIGGFINVLINRIYCIRTFAICKFKKPHNKKLFLEMFKYTGWSLGGQFVNVLSSQGVSILVNVFFSVVANAAMGVSNQITHIVSNFVNNFQTAFQPQITKKYVTHNFNSLYSLAIRSSRISSFLVIIFMIPICFQIKNFLSIWLGNYPEYAIEFCILTLLCIYLDAISAPLWMILCSDKNIKKYQITISIIYTLIFLVSWIILKIGLKPYFVIAVRFVVYIIAIAARLLLVKEKLPSFPALQWIKETIGTTIRVLLIPVPLLFLLTCLNIKNNYIELILFGGISVILTAVSIFIFGLTKHEKDYIIIKLQNLFIKKHTS